VYDEILLEAQKNGIRDTDLHHDYALLLSNGLKKYKEASSHYLKAIAYCTEDGDATKNKHKKANICGNYAGLLRTMKAYDKAREYFEQALALNPDDVHHLSNYADLLREMGEYQESKTKFNEAISIIELAEMEQKSSSAASSQPKSPSSPKKRVSKLLTPTATTPNSNRRASGKRSSAIYKRNSALDTKVTRAAIEKSNAFTKSNVGKTYSNYALLLFSMKSYKESWKFYHRAIEIDSENQVRHYNFARLLYDTQEWQLAVTHLEIALELSCNEHAASYWLYGRILMEQQQFDKSELYLKNAIQLSRDNPLYRCDHILCLLESRKYEEAVNEMQNYKKLKIQYLYFDLVYTYFIAKVRGERDEAGKNFQILMKQIPPNHPTSINSKFIYYYYYAWFLQYMAKDYVNAMKYYALTLELRPKHALTAYHYSVAIISKWMHIASKRKNKQLDVVDEVDLNEEQLEEQESTHECGEEQVTEYQLAQRLIERAYALNKTVPIIQQHYQQLVQRIERVVGDGVVTPAVSENADGISIYISHGTTPQQHEHEEDLDFDIADDEKVNDYK